MSHYIKDIEDAAPRSRARRLTLSDGAVVQTSAAVVKVLGLSAGDQIEVEELNQSIVQAEDGCDRERALRLLGYRERTVAELTNKLDADGYQLRTVRSTVDRMRELGLVDDARFARLWIRTRIRAGYGPRRIERELGDRGVCRQAIELAMAEEWLVDPVVAARGHLLARWPRDRKERERTIRRLTAEGFEMGTILQALADAPTDADEPF